MVAFVREPLSTERGIPVFTEPSPYTENYDHIAKDHLAAEARTGHNPFIPEDVWRDSERSTVELIQKYTRPGDRILDAGVGLGRILGDLPDRERYGADISLDYLERAKAKGIEVALALVEDLPYGSESFDAVLATDILEHVLDLNAAIREMLRVLRPGGSLIIRIPNQEDLAYYLDEGYPYKYVHLRTFDEPSVRLLFTRAFDCEVVDVRLAGYMASAGYMRPVMPWRLRLAFSRYVLEPLIKRGRRGLMTYWYRPIEINAVVRKPT